MLQLKLAVLAVAIALLSTTASAQGNALERAAKALGAAELKSLNVAAGATMKP